MGKTAIFIITESDKGLAAGNSLNITNKQYNTYNRYGVRKADLFNVMCELADIFNNVIGIGITFVVE